MGSRLVIIIAMLAIPQGSASRCAPLLPAPRHPRCRGGVQAEFSWGVFSAWDSLHYQQIATTGYDIQKGSFGDNVAFFPLFPLAIRALMNLGLLFEVADTLLSNLAFLGALIVLFTWVEKRHGISAARWATAVLAWCPFSLFGTVIYTEGLFLLWSTAALYTFDNKQYFWAALWGALATATRAPGLALIPAFLMIAFLQRRGTIAYISGLLTGTGVLLYSLYCWFQFGEPLAFILVQKAWQPEQAFWGQGWLKMLSQIAIGWEKWHLPLFCLICAIGYCLWRWRGKLGRVKTDYGFCTLFMILWILAGDPFINTVMVGGGIFLLWHSRKIMGSLPWLYGLFSMVIILSPGRTISAERHVYGIVSVAIALGFVLQNHPRWRYPLWGFSSLLLALFAIRFAQHLWVA